jgi:colanic acid biosynthesis protein WcaH
MKRERVEWQNALATLGPGGDLLPAMLLDNEKFLQVIEATPLVSVDLIFRNAAGEVLLGKRTNPPAQGFWFVPGGRIRKGERIEQALQRVCRAELGVGLEQATLLGTYNHLYEENFLSRPGIGTHYVVLGFECSLIPGEKLQPDQQHSDLLWWSLPALLDSPEVHPLTKGYFNSSANRFTFPKE